MAGRWRMESIGGAFSSASTYNPTSYHASLAFLDFFPTFSLPLLPIFTLFPTFPLRFPPLSLPNHLPYLSFQFLSFFPFPSPPLCASFFIWSKRPPSSLHSTSLSLSLFLLPFFSPPPLSIDVAALYNHSEKSRSIRDPFAKAHLQTANGPTFRFPYSSTYSTYIEHYLLTGGIQPFCSWNFSPSSQLDLVAALFWTRARHRNKGIKGKPLCRPDSSHLRCNDRYGYGTTIVCTQDNWCDIRFPPFHRTCFSSFWSNLSVEDIFILEIFTFYPSERT